MSQEVQADALQRLQSEIHYEFKQVKFLIQALSHSSYANEQNCTSNERLEFLGDAVLELTISEQLFMKFPHAQEGQLTKMRSSMVSETALAAVARKIDVGSYLLLGKGEDAQGGRERNSVLSDTVEAILGAAYLDGGLKAAQCCVSALFAEQWPIPPESFRPKDFKSLLQEETQKIWKARPTYALIKSQGPEHAKEYLVEVTLPDERKVYRADSSVRKAEQGAAAQALNMILASKPDQECH